MLGKSLRPFVNSWINRIAVVVREIAPCGIGHELKIDELCPDATYYTFSMPRYEHTRKEQVGNNVWGGSTFSRVRTIPASTYAGATTDGEIQPTP